MILLPLVIAAIGGGLLAWSLRESVRVSALTGVLALLLVGWLAAVAPAGSTGSGTDAASTLGGEPIALDTFSRLFLVAGAAAGIGLTILSVVLPRSLPGAPAGAVPGDARDGPGTRGDRAIAHQPNPAAAFLLFLAAAALALGLVSPLTALIPAAAAGLAGFVAIGRLASDLRPRGGRADDGARDAEAPLLSRRLGMEVWRTAAAFGLALVALDLLVGLADPLAGDPFGVGAALLAVAAAVALRLGIAPFHGHAIRIGEYAPRAAAPLLLLWGPALFALIVLGGNEAAILPLGVPLHVERGAIAAFAVLTIVAGGVGALVQDDLDHLVAYSVVQDAAFVILAFASADSAAWGPARTWLVVLPLAKSALLAWATAVGRTYGTRSLLELRGWARRAPLLAIALGLVLLATVGVPGLAAWDARIGLIRGAFTEPLRSLVLLASLSAVLVLVRVLLIGADRPTSLVVAAPDEQLRRPAPDLRRRIGATARLALDLNRAPLTAVTVVALALVAVAFGAGLFNLRGAASADLPAALPGSEPPTGPITTFQPVATDQPSASPSGSVVVPTPTLAPTRTPPPSRTPAATRTASPRATR